MRLIRILVVVLTCACIGFYIWATVRFNEDYDNVPPKLICDSTTLELSVEDGEEALYKGITATDDQDGDLTGEILLSGKSFFLESGVFEAEYVVFDSYQNFCQITRRIHYTDYTSPEFRVSQPLIFQRGENIRYLNYVTARDVLDGDITDQIKVLASNVSNYTAGTYPVLLEVSNSYGDTVQVELMVVVREKNSANVSIALSEYLVYLTVGEEFDPYRLIESVTTTDASQRSKQKVQVLGTVDTQTEGCYQLIYSYDEDDGYGQAYLTVVVKEGAAQ